MRRILFTVIWRVVLVFIFFCTLGFFDLGKTTLKTLILLHFQLFVILLHDDTMAAWRIDTTWGRLVVIIDVADRNSHVFLDEALHPYRLTSSNLFLRPFFPDLLLTFPKLFDQYSPLHSLQSDEYHDKERHGQATKQNCRIYPANDESHILVSANKSTSVEGNHEIRQDYQDYIMEDLQSVEWVAGVRVVKTRSIDHNCAR